MLQMARVVEINRFTESAKTVHAARWTEVPAREQMTNRRYLQWLNERTVGSFDPVTKRFEKRDVRYIAKFYGVTERAVRKGLAIARELTEGINDAKRAAAH